MQPLKAVVAEALKLSKLDDVAPESCKLIFNKKEQDLATPIRFAGLPASAKLELVTGRGLGSPAGAGAGKPSMLRMQASVVDHLQRKPGATKTGQQCCTGPWRFLLAPLLQVKLPNQRFASSRPLMPEYGC